MHKIVAATKQMFDWCLTQNKTQSSDFGGRLSSRDVVVWLRKQLISIHVTYDWLDKIRIPLFLWVPIFNYNKEGKQFDILDQNATRLKLDSSRRVGVIKMGSGKNTHSRYKEGRPM